VRVHSKRWGAPCAALTGPAVLPACSAPADAKNRWRTTTSQNESEWVTYAAALHRMQHYCEPLPLPIPDPTQRRGNSTGKGRRHPWA